MDIVIRGTRETGFMVMLKDGVTETYIGMYTEWHDADRARYACEGLLSQLKAHNKLS